jgi:hypothetical protein
MPVMQHFRYALLSRLLVAFLASLSARGVEIWKLVYGIEIKTLAHQAVRKEIHKTVREGELLIKYCCLLMFPNAHRKQVPGALRLSCTFFSRFFIRERRSHS